MSKPFQLNLFLPDTLLSAIYIAEQMFRSAIPLRDHREEWLHMREIDEADVSTGVIIASI